LKQYSTSFSTSYLLISGLVGRNGTGKTSFLRAMAMHAIDGIPKNCQILHVEQEVVGDDTTALQCVLNADVDDMPIFLHDDRSRVTIAAIPGEHQFMIPLRRFEADSDFICGVSSASLTSRRQSEG